MSATLAKALKAESTQLGVARHELTLFSGEYLGTFAEHFYYRFEIPEKIYLHRIERASFTFGRTQQVTFEGRIVSLDNQFLMVGLPMDLGSILPEIKCSWTHEEHLKLTFDALGEAEDVHPVASILLEPEREMYFCVERDLAHRKDVNLLSEYLGGDILSRHSLATENAAIRLPIDVCHNEDEFWKIMERWNFLIYETSGVGKTDLSFFARHTPEARVLWDIISLRAYYSSTVEAVVKEGKHRVAASVSKVFQECLGKPQPANPVEWSTVYLNFLGKMETYLAWISEQLRR